MPAGYKYSSTAPQTTLTAGISNTDLTCQVATQTGYPVPPYEAVLDIGEANEEAVAVTNVSADTLTITRGVDGTTASNHGFGATLTHVVIGLDVREFRAHLDASTSPDAQNLSIHGLEAGSHVVGTLDAQTLSAKTLSSPDVTGTVSGGASYTSPTLTGVVGGSADYTSPEISGTVSGNATYSGITLTGTTPASGATLTSPTLQDATVVNDVVGNSPLIVNGVSGTSASLQKWEVNGALLAFVTSSGAQHSPAFAASGLTGATTSSVYGGATGGGPPTSGSWSVGQWVVDTVYGIVWTCISAGTPGTWSPSGAAVIQRQVLGGNVASVSFNTIPSYWTNLRLKISARTNGTLTGGFAQIAVQWNGLSAADYNSGALFGTFPSTASVASSTGQTFGELGDVWGSHFATTGTGRIDCTFPSYADSVWNKGLVSDSFVSDGGSVGRIGVFGSAYSNSQAAITSLTLTASDSSSFLTGSVFELIGEG